MWSFAICYYLLWYHLCDKTFSKIKVIKPHFRSKLIRGFSINIGSTTETDSKVIQILLLCPLYLSFFYKSTWIIKKYSICLLYFEFNKTMGDCFSLGLVLTFVSWITKSNLIALWRLTKKICWYLFYYSGLRKITITDFSLTFQWCRHGED